LTGLDKTKTAEKYGEEQVHIWRRSYDIPPPSAKKDSEYHPANDERYNHLIFSDEFTETLATTSDRVVPYYKKEIEPLVKSGKTVIVAAHGNSLRALVKHLDGIDEETIPKLNIPTGTPLVYTFDRNMNVIESTEAISPLRGRYLGDQEVVKARILGVQNQGTKH
jgi:2,3-bisphosphoglycerate-dependent phosphoglycerate mutase